MAVMVIVSILLAVSFVGIAIWKLRGNPESISSMVYLLPEGSWRYVWTVWIWCIALMIGPSLIEAMPERCQFVAFFTMACLSFCGAMPLIRGDRNTAHNIFGMSAGVLSQVCVAIISLWWLLSWCMFLPILIDFYVNRVNRWYSGKEVFLAECVCYVSMVGSLLS